MFPELVAADKMRGTPSSALPTLHYKRTGPLLRWPVVFIQTEQLRRVGVPCPVELGEKSKLIMIFINYST
jgi:hypothetical protein